MTERATYKLRFENLFRLALKVTSSLDIGDILVGPETAKRIKNTMTLYGVSGEMPCSQQANSPLVVNPNAVLTLSVAMERF